MTISPSAVPGPQTTSQASSRARSATLIAALLGWLFDGFEMGLFPLIGPAALKDLLGPDASQADATNWFSVIIAVFLVGAASGGVLFGWLGDKIGRVRAMSLSIFTYAIFTGLCGFVAEAWQIAALRFIASLGMGGEWSLGVALVNEIWPGKSRAFIAGLIGAASNVGFLLVALLSLALTQVIGSIESVLLTVGVSQQMTDLLLANSAWRFLMISGSLPALLIFFIRLFVPESARWEQERASGRTSHWSNADLTGLFVGCSSAVAIIAIWSPVAKTVPTWLAVLVTVIGLTVTLVSFLYPVRQFLRRAELSGSIAPGQQTIVINRMLLGASLAGVALLGTWGSIQWAPRWADKLKPDTDGVRYFAREKTQAATATGAIVATVLAAMAADKFGRRNTYAAMCIGAFASTIYFFQFHDTFDTGFLVAATLAGGVTASFYGFFPLYFPELFPTAVRATGQGFSFNFGRILAAVGGLQTATLMSAFGGSFAKAGATLSAIYLLGIAIVWLGPETKGQPLPE